jgi:cell division protein FtsB
LQLLGGLEDPYVGIGRKVEVEDFGDAPTLHRRVDALLKFPTDPSAKRRVVVVAPLAYETVDGEQRDGVADFYDPVRTHDEVSVVLVGEANKLVQDRLHNIVTSDNKPGKVRKITYAPEYKDVGRVLLDEGIFAPGAPEVPPFPRTAPKPEDGVTFESEAGASESADAGGSADEESAGAQPDASKKGGGKRGLYIGLGALLSLGALAVTAKIASDLGYNKGFDEFVPQLDDYKRRNGTLSTDKAALQKQVGNLTKEAGDYKAQVDSLTSDKASLNAEVNDLDAQVAGLDQQDAIDLRDRQSSSKDRRISDLTTSGEQCGTDLATCRGELEAAQAAPTKVAAQQHCRYPDTFRCNYPRAEYRHSPNVILPQDHSRQPGSTGRRARQ